MSLVAPAEVGLVEMIQETQLETLKSRPEVPPPNLDPHTNPRQRLLSPNAAQGALAGSVAAAASLQPLGFKMSQVDGFRYRVSALLLANPAGLGRVCSWGCCCDLNGAMTLCCGCGAQVENLLGNISRTVIKNARIEGLKKELVNSQKLKELNYFEEHVEELGALQVCGRARPALQRACEDRTAN